jgi:uncharacterized protein
MDVELSANEVRVLAALVEKDLTTPDQYPLSLNALTSACNQKSNREPVLSLSDTDVLAALDGLVAHAMAGERRQSGSRVTRYAHRLSGGVGLRFTFSGNALGTLAILMLRGPQTVGEIKARSGRMCDFDSLNAVQVALDELAKDQHGPYVVKLARQPGTKESRYAQLWSGAVADVVQAHEARAEFAPAPASINAPENDARIAQLESDVAELRAELESLKSALGE